MSDDQPVNSSDMSLITGKMRTIGCYGDDDEAEGSTAVVKRDEMLTVANIQANTAGMILSHTKCHLHLYRYCIQEITSW